jgi:hypothetical protein
VKQAGEEEISIHIPLVDKFEQKGKLLNRHAMNSLYGLRTGEPPIYGGLEKRSIRIKGRLLPKKRGLSTVFTKLSTATIVLNAQIERLKSREES